MQHCGLELLVYAAKQNATPERPSARSSNAAVPRALKTQDAAALMTRHEAAIKTQKDAAARKAQETAGLKLLVYAALSY
jgi:hypothetical protein